MNEKRLLVFGSINLDLAFFAPKGPKEKPKDPKAKTAVAAAKPQSSDLAPAPLAPADSTARVAQLGAFAAIAASDAGQPVC